MCSIGVCFGVCPFIFMNSISNCKGVLLNNLIKSVSVVIFNGMRFNITTFNGRMSCDEARIESITNICSLFSNSIAGRFLCKFKGIFYYVFWSLNIITFCKDNRNIGIKILSRQVSFPETVRQVIRMAESLCGNPSFLRLKRY